MNDKLMAIAVQEAPAIVSLIRSSFARAHPNEAPPTDAEIHDAYVAAWQQSLANGDAWLAAHPKKNP